MAVLMSKQMVVPFLGKKLSDYAVGESVFLNVNGIAKEFLVVNQGKPSSLYDDSCNDTWLLMKDVYESRVFDSNNNDYKNSDIHTYLNGTFIGLFDSDVQSAIKQVKIPYVNGTGKTGSVASGSSGLSTKVFLLGGYEVGWKQSMDDNFSDSTPLFIDGYCLSYFNGTSLTDTRRIAYTNGTATSWYSRTPTGSDDIFTINTGGGWSSYYVGNALGIRPALIMPGATLFDEDNKFKKGVA